jgi:hypothetical protein
MLDNLRIDKIGKYYSVRLGKFDERSAAEKFLQSNKHHLHKAIILEAYVNESGKKSELPEQKKKSALEAEVVTEGDIVIAEQDNTIIEHNEKNILNDQNVSNIISANDFPAPEKSNITNNHEAQVTGNLYKLADPAVSLSEKTAETVQAKSSMPGTNLNP